MRSNTLTRVSNNPGAVQLGFPPGARRSFAGARRRSKPARRMSGTRRTPGSRPRWANSRWRARSCGRRSTAWRPAAL